MNFNIEKFKCFSSANVTLNSLTILCGANASGKSTIIQALLLYRIATLSKINSPLSINGQFGLALGDSEELLYQKDSDTSEVIKFGFKDHIQNETNFIELGITSAKIDDHLSKKYTRSLFITKKPKNLFLKSKKPFYFTYLSAERNGPRVSQEKFSDDTIGDQFLGTKGEFTAEVLHQESRKKIRPELVFQFRENQKGVDSQLLQATQNWLSTIVGEVAIQTVENGKAPPSLLFKRPGLYSEWTSSTNTGFGISYTLPIIVAGLLSAKNGFLIVDSPEAHLHPAAQTALAKFLTWIASSGVKVIIESHSDHIIDGVRLAIVSEKYKLKYEDCSIINISRNEHDDPEIKSISVKSNGSLSEWPKGFFDQQITNLRNIAIEAKKANG